MKLANKLIIPILIGLLGGGCAGSLSERAEKKTIPNSRECIVEKGVNMFSEPYVIPGVLDEEGNCIELLDTAPKTVSNRVTYSLLEGRIVELKDEGYTIRVADQNRDGNVDTYAVVDTLGNIVIEIFRDLKTGKVYSKCTLPGRVIDGLDVKLENNANLDDYNDTLTNPGKYGFRVISR
ncbi:MAG: hypothetical protein L6408_05830 [Nanoarchaeota archaeon]|nr:hypothetical protein [Nanoarchaeota archaeon]